MNHMPVKLLQGYSHVEAGADGSDDTTDNDIKDNVKEKSKPAYDNSVANKSLFVQSNRIFLERAQPLR